ncbi:uncharacterized protein NECHADRAFT_105662 [Fusarium vanettenii 77-13-4]|uniref:HD domain-containing protein n=1 Tax=Fusarium vanettenii (strain ATCC MYA-4622 / CBS 123669 / FGSC 9596 / NRRL 45880 / 77-13-4) TaxID=660122 RepID=C7ZLA2_FUSV7|nr:uncharacterized protein NECHADRAFT_105662 [Fusarium vanettenii 77-13-4]EEU35199.1 hypothetical protein NECHADRAFT_105662 [Fusarium vanettenii 77-13-4]
MCVTPCQVAAGLVSLSWTIHPVVLHRIPVSSVCQSAIALARNALPKPILNHSLRVYLLALWLAEKEQSSFASDPHMSRLFVAAIHHDMGASDLYNGSQRFELCSADCAKTHLLEHDYSEAESHQVWTAIAVHTSPGIAERIDPLSRLIRLGVNMDFGSEEYRERMGVTEFYNEIEKLLPRLEVEKSLGDAVVKQAKKIPHVDSLTWPSDEKFPLGSWPGILLRAHAENPDHVGVNPAF